MGITQQIGASSLIKPGVIDNAAARPASPFEGQVIFQKDTDQLLVWNGTAWVIPNQTTQNPEALELVKTQTIGSGVTSVEVTNAFSSTYDNYKIMVSGGGNNSGGRELRLQLGATVTGYHYWLTYSPWNGTSAAEGTKTATIFPYCGASNSTASAGGQRMNLEISNPFLANYTTITAMWDDDVANVGTLRGALFNTTSYTSFTLTANGAAMTGGTIRVYGYRNS